MGENEAIMPTHEVDMITIDQAEQIRLLTKLGWGAARIKEELGRAKNTVKAYRRGRRAGCAIPRRSRGAVPGF